MLISQRMKLQIINVEDKQSFELWRRELEAEIALESRYVALDVSTLVTLASSTGFIELDQLENIVKSSDIDVFRRRQLQHDISQRKREDSSARDSIENILQLFDRVFLSANVLKEFNKIISWSSCIASDRERIRGEELLKRISELQTAASTQSDALHLDLRPTKSLRAENIDTLREMLGQNCFVFLTGNAKAASAIAAQISKQTQSKAQQQQQMTILVHPVRSFLGPTLDSKV